VTGILRAPRRTALVAISVLIAAASLVAFGESYRGLYLWAHHHGLPGVWAAVFPAQIDTFMAVGELALFVALADRWPPRSRLAAWLVTLAGLVVSVAGNVGHVTSGSFSDRATWAVPPIAAAAALAVGLGVLKRVVEHHHRAAAKPTPGTAPGHTGPPRTRARAQAQSRGTAPVTPEHAELHFAPMLAAGTVPSLRQVRAQLHVGTDRARQLRAHLASLDGRTAP
jgi:Protein of unknown function (DUF2637)